MGKNYEYNSTRRKAVMANFTNLYKKMFRETLYPQGYKLWKSVFYKETESLCYFIHGKQNIHALVPNTIQIYIEIVPYCIDIEDNNYDPREDGTDIIKIYSALFPEILIENKIIDYYDSRLLATNEETIYKSLCNLQEDFVSIILPYVQKMNDLNYLYEEKFNVWTFHPNENRKHINYFLFGLSLKLHKYDTATPYLEHKFKWYTSLINTMEARLTELEKGNAAAVFGIPTTGDFVKKLLKRNPSFIESHITSAIDTIKVSENEIKKYQHIKEAIMKRNDEYVDNYIYEIEKKSKKYIRCMIEGEMNKS